MLSKSAFADDDYDDDPTLSMKSATKHLTNWMEGVQWMRINQTAQTSNFKMLPLLMRRTEWLASRFLFQGDFFQKSVLFLLQTMSVNLYSLYVWSVVSALENDKPTMSVDILMFSIGHLLMFLIGHISMFSIGHLCKSFLRSNYVFGGRKVGWSVIVHWDPD